MPLAGGRLARRVGVALAVSVAAVSAPAVASADDCPNAAVRAQQHAEHLPNCMAYEQVTPAEKVGALPKLAAVADDGNGVLFGMLSVIGDQQQSFHFPQFRALPGTGEGEPWTTDTLLPSLEGPLRRARLGDAFDTRAWSGDLSRVLIQTTFPFSPNDQGTGTGVGNTFGSDDLYLREPDGTLRWMVPDPSVASTEAGSVGFRGASPDLERVVMATARKFDPRATVQQAYLWTPEGVRLVSELPGGLPSAVAVVSTAVSADARRIAFTTGTSAAQRVYVRFDADDPQRAVTREVAVGPNGEACTPPATSVGAVLQQLSADGSQVIFICANALLPGAPANANYVRDLDGGPEAVRLLGPGTVLGGNADFSRIYMTGSQGGSGPLSVVRDGVPTLVGAVAQAASGASALRSSAISPDGEYLVFESSTVWDLPGVDQGPTSRPQVFLASARTGELRCLSCQPAGTATSGVGSLANLESDVSLVVTGVVAPVSDRGTVVFSTTTGLVPEDTDGETDAYAWVDGEPVLLSGGRGGSSVAAGASADGSRFFVMTPDALVPDDRDGGQFDLYVARANGGSLAQAPSASCTSGCQGAGPERPGLPAVGTGSVLPDGNLVETPVVERATVGLSGARSVRGSSVSVRVKVSGAGSIRVSGNGLRRETRSVKRAGTYSVRVRLSSYGLRQQRKRGRFVTRAAARLTPSAKGGSVTTRRTVTFNRAPAKGGR